LVVVKQGFHRFYISLVEDDESSGYKKGIKKSGQQGAEGERSKVIGAQGGVIKEGKFS
jgi:hypothetical protein